ncbi:hypothetical protein [Desulfolutivibrio sulfoxidireducens]|uniref:hypothetical protein n=1 Tax=Desulfolutivibrio sulfoxidireducens TaxID=2773299 RepID=UPI00159D77D6|nr:hypothetical protein [Desulfolutivibrio sulfoxidireducens]QLA18540.1 hypothetical protein GD604_01750 [Desulfolutivibrio sulfoxidireducens]
MITVSSHPHHLVPRSASRTTIPPLLRDSKGRSPLAAGGFPPAYFRKHLAPAVLFCLLLTAFPAGPGLAQSAVEPTPQPSQTDTSGTTPAPGSSVRSPARDDLLSTVGVTCAFGPKTSEADARRQCFLKARSRLTVKMAEQVRGAASSLGLDLSDEELFAFTLGTMRVEADREEIEPEKDGFVIRLTGRAVADLAGLRQKLPFYAQNQDVRAAAVAQWRAALSEAELAARSAGDPAEAQAAKTRRAMVDTARFAERQLRLGMSQTDVRGLLGEPGAWTQGASGENFTCLGYGDVWAVFQNGELACLRTRLEYSRRHESQCHCSGRLATIVLGVEPQ